MVYYHRKLHIFLVFSFKVRCSNLHSECYLFLDIGDLSSKCYNDPCDFASVCSELAESFVMRGGHPLALETENEENYVVDILNTQYRAKGKIV